MSRNLNVGIVGGSIAGCAAAVELARRGHSVRVFERSSEELTGRGAGIGTPTSLLQKLIDRDLVDPGIPRFLAASYPMVGRSPSEPVLGHVALSLPLSMALLNWADLYLNLRKRVPDNSYVAGMSAVGISTTSGEGGTTLHFSDGPDRTFDLVVFADGYRSAGRQYLYPEAQPEYRGYVLWRGVLDEKRLEDSDPLESSLYRLHYKGLPGNAVFYFVPGINGSVEKGRRLVNWACYVPISNRRLAAFLVDREGKQHATSIPPGLMRLKEEERLKALMRIHLPSYFSDIVDRSVSTFAQPIYTVEIPAYVKHRCCLIGDAGFVAQPFTGSGVFKAANNAIELADALDPKLDLDACLASWSDTQVASAKGISVLGRQMEQAFVWSAPDFAEMDEASAGEWWRNAVTFPEDFRYVESRP